VALSRAFSSGQLSWDLLTHVVYLAVMGLIGLFVASRRLGVLLLT
jgi:lipooligosaccharide transport system permease protein